MDPNNLSDAEKAALAKAEANGVNVVQKDGSVAPLTEGKPAPAPNATADVKPGDKPAAPAEGATAPKQRPADVPEKFWDAEKGEVNTAALLKSYGELERARTRPQEPPKPAQMGEQKPEAKPAEGEQKPAETPPAKTPEQLAAEANAARNAASEAATADIQRDGKISDGTYQQLEAAGYSRAQVDQYVAGLQAQATLQINAMHDLVGGRAEFEKMVAWGGTTYSAEEQAAFNAALGSGDKGQQALAVNGLKSRYAAEFGKGGKQVDTTPSTNATNAFRSRAELIDAMKDPRYTKGDPTFHREVAERIAASARANIDIGLYVQQ